jgi:hypothetical protein
MSDRNGHRAADADYPSGLGAGGYTTNFNSGGNSVSSNPSNISGYAYGYSNIFGSFVVKKEADGRQTPIWRGPSGNAGAHDAKVNANSLNNGSGLISNTSKDRANNPNGIYYGSIGQIFINGRLLTIATSCGSCFAQKAVVGFNSPVLVKSFIPLVQNSNLQLANSFAERFEKLGGGIPIYRITLKEQRNGYFQMV